MASPIKTARELIGALSSPAIVKAKPPIRAYHGSPHDFPKFDLSKIGTGEGAQAYGHGLYFAGDEAVARHYRDKLSMGSSSIDGKLMSEIAAQKHQLPYGQQPTTEHDIADIVDSYGDNARPVMASRYPELLATYDKMVADGRVSAGHMYEVDLHADPDSLLNWDLPISAQPANVRGVLGDGAETAAAKLSRAYRSPRFGGDIVGKDTATPDEVSRALAERGIPGIRYLDNHARHYGDGSSNFVMFDDKLIDVRRKYEDGGLVDEPQHFDDGGSVSLDDIMSSENLAAAGEFNARYPALTQMTPETLAKKLDAQDYIEGSGVMPEDDGSNMSLPPGLSRLDATARGVNSAIPFSQDIRAGLRTVAGAGAGDYLDFGDRFSENKAREMSLDEGAISEYPLEFVGGMAVPSVMMPGLAATQAVTLPGKLAAGAAVGGALGYASGLGDGTTLDERLANASENAKWSAGIGAAFPAAGPMFRAAKKAAPYLTGAAAGTAAATAGSDEAEANIYGVMSKLADRKALAKARSMATKGAEREEIVGETNWFQDLNDGKWKYHSQPKGLGLNMPFDEDGHMIEDVLRHPELFEAYPQLKGLQVKADPTMEGASYNHRLGRIKLGDHSDDYFQSSGGELGSMLHEAQHAIQELEGFSPGTNPSNAFDAAKKIVRSKVGGTTAEQLRSIEKDPEAKDRLGRWLYHFNAGEEEARRAERFGVFGRRPEVMPWTTDITGYSDEALIGNRNPSRETMRMLVNRAHGGIGYADGGEVEVDHLAEIQALADGM